MDDRYYYNENGMILYDREAKPCPKCGKTTISIRRQAYSNLSVAYCCGGTNCRFYQAANTEEEAFNLWQKATKETLPQEIIHKKFKYYN